PHPDMLSTMRMGAMAPLAQEEPARAHPGDEAEPGTVAGASNTLTEADRATSLPADGLAGAAATDAAPARVEQPPQDMTTAAPSDSIAGTPADTSPPQAQSTVPTAAVAAPVTADLHATSQMQQADAAPATTA